VLLATQINGDWETQRVLALGTGAYGEYDAVLENSFSEPLLRTTPWAWYTMLSPVRCGSAVLRHASMR
jgi:hypothetical protein